MKSFKEKTDERLAALHLQASPDDIRNALPQRRPPRTFRRHRLYAAIAVVCILLTLSSSVFAVQTFQKAEKTRQEAALDFFLQHVEASLVLGDTFEAADEESFYLRYLSDADMAVIDKAAEDYGAALYFEGLQSENIYVQYFCINKLVEFYDDPGLRSKALESITPFLSDENSKLAQAAAFAAAILSGSFEHPWIYRLYDGSVIFTLFNEYSAYGSYPSLYRIKEDHLETFLSLDKPMYYISEIKLTENREKAAILTCSNKSQQLFAVDFANGLFSPELVMSAMAEQASIKDYSFFVRTDFETYSTVNTLEWVDDNTVLCEMQLAFDGADTVDTVSARYRFREKELLLSDTAPAI